MQPRGWKKVAGWLPSAGWTGAPPPPRGWGGITLGNTLLYFLKNQQGGIENNFYFPKTGTLAHWHRNIFFLIEVTIKEISVNFENIK